MHATSSPLTKKRAQNGYQAQETVKETVTETAKKPPTDLRHQLPVHRHARAAVKVEAAAVTAALVGVQVHAARL